MKALKWEHFTKSICPILSLRCPGPLPPHRWIRTYLTANRFESSRRIRRTKSQSGQWKITYNFIGTSVQHFQTLAPRPSRSHSKTASPSHASIFPSTSRANGKIPSPCVEIQKTSLRSKHKDHLSWQRYVGFWPCSYQMSTSSFLQDQDTVFHRTIHSVHMILGSSWVLLVSHDQSISLWAIR
jgi:hypothetical protein